jgi:hypothetical protein
VNCSLKSLNKLDKAERAKLKAVINVQLSGGVNVINWNAILADFNPLTLQTEETSLSACRS